MTALHLYYSRGHHPAQENTCLLQNEGTNVEQSFSPTMDIMILPSDVDSYCCLHCVYEMYKPATAGARAGPAAASGPHEGNRRRGNTPRLW